LKKSVTTFGLVMIDYLQLIDPGPIAVKAGKSRLRGHLAPSEVFWRAKLKVPVGRALHRFKPQQRGSARTNRPRLKRLAWNRGAIEQDARYRDDAASAGLP